MTGGSGSMVGESLAMRRLRETITRVAPARLPVLIQGPTGAGKELVARALHEGSGRPGRFVAFNVCAITDAMFEDALFGHVRGAFTGAVHDSPGFLMEAHRGTVFLDEIGGLPLSAQAKLLRAIEHGVFRPVGGRHDATSDFRVIAAINEPLAMLVERGAFRRDLAHRLGGIVLDVPALNARLEDVPLLVREFLRRVPAPAPELAPDAIARLQAHVWPGNVRELRHTIEALAALHPGRRVGAAEVTALVEPRTAADAAPATSFAARRLIEVMEMNGWNISAAADSLQIHRATLYRRLRRLGIVADGGQHGYVLATCRRLSEEAVNGP